MSVLPVVVASASPGVAAACVAGAYLLGTFPTARLASRRRGVDPTGAGSRNPGATNVYRTAGRRAGVLTLVGDVVKGATAAGLGWAVGGHGLGVACGVAAVVGHVAPLTRPSRGGKGVATVAGMALVLFPLAAVVSGAAPPLWSCQWPPAPSGRPDGRWRPWSSAQCWSSPGTGPTSGACGAARSPTWALRRE